MRQCPFACCEEQLPDHLFACRAHWFRLSYTQRQTIHAAYDDYKADAISLERLREIQKDIIEAVERKVAKK